MTIAEALKRFRKQFNLKQKDVAEKLGMTTQAYASYETKSIPSSAIIVTISKYYNISADYLLGLSDRPRPAELAELDFELMKASISLRDTIQVLGELFERKTKMESTLNKK